jgi:voltage-gated potassium channel
MAFTLAFLKIFVLGLILCFPVLLLLALVVVILGLIVGRREKWSRLDSVYYAFMTATTVGYGDLRPRERAGKCLAIAIAFTGVLLTGIIVALGLRAAQVAFKAHYGTDVNRYQESLSGTGSSAEDAQDHVQDDG